MPRLLTFACLMVWLVLSDVALAAAWTRTPGTSFTAQATKFFTTELTSDNDLPFRKVIANSYFEYGLFEGITIGGELDYAQRADGAEESLVGVFVRTRLWQSDSDVLSAQIGGGYPVLSALAADNAARDVTPDLRLGLAYGRGLAWGAGA